MANIKPLSYSEVSNFCAQMAMILKSGISSYEGLTIMAEDAVMPEEKSLLSLANETLIQTGSFYEALKATGAFPEYMMSMVQIGERTGNLDDVLDSLAVYYEKEAGLLVTIKNAITYPCVMILMMIAVILLLITKVLPIFNQVFNQLGSKMTGVSGGILALGEFLNNHSAVLITILVLIVALGVFLLKTKPGQRALFALSGKLRFANRFAERVATYRFANGMALTLSSGLTPEECVTLSSQLITNEAFLSKTKVCSENIQNGESLTDSLLKSNVFSGLHTRMISIGSRTGDMDGVMKKIADIYEEEIDTRITKMLATIEPTLVVILSIAVGIILLSVMLPLINIMSSL